MNPTQPLPIGVWSTPELIPMGLWLVVDPGGTGVAVNYSGLAVSETPFQWRPLSESAIEVRTEPPSDPENPWEIAEFTTVEVELSGRAASGLQFALLSPFWSDEPLVFQRPAK